MPQKLDSPEQETRLVPEIEDSAAAWEIYKGVAPDPGREPETGSTIQFAG